MNAAQFAQQIELLTDRAAQLSERASAATVEESGLLLEVFEELRTALEELFVAQEELLTQNQELAIARNQAEKERQRYQDLFEFAPDGYFVTDEVGIIRAANRAAALLLNVLPQYLIGKPLSNFIPYEERPTFRTTLNEIKERDWMPEWQLRIAPRQGEVFEAAMTASAMQPTEKGKAKEWHWLLRDISDRLAVEAATRRAQIAEAANTMLQREIKERQQLEVALRESEERYRAFSELTSDYTYAYRLELDGTFVPERLSEAFTRICGYTVEDIALGGWKSLILYKDRAIVLRQVQQLLAGQSEPCEHRLLTKQGEIRWVRHYARPAWEIVPDYPFRIFRIYGAAQDITESKRLELERSQLLESEQSARIEAQAANRLKDNFLAIVSHELRTPLNAILGWTQLLAQGNFDELQTSQALKTIERNALLQNKLIEDLLDISRIVRGKIRLYPVQTDLVPVIEAAIASVQQNSCISAI